MQMTISINITFGTVSVTTKPHTAAYKQLHIIKWQNNILHKNDETPPIGKVFQHEYEMVTSRNQYFNSLGKASECLNDPFSKQL